MAIAGSFRFSYAFACIPSFMIVGAIIQGTFPRLGRVLICGGAIVLSYWVFIGEVSLSIETGATYPQIGLTLASVLILALCDYAIAIEEIKIRGAHKGKKSEVVPFSKNIRWLTGATGCLTAVTVSFAAGLGFAIVPFCLILGAALAGRSPRNGRNLIWFGAGLLSLSGLPLGVWFLVIAFQRGTALSVIVGAAASVLLIVLCDVAIVMEAIKMRRTRIAGNSTD